jgi:cytochrome d ubiquinol oxidase subunit I
VPLQILAGDLHGLNVGEHQPVKLAAMEGHWHDGEPGEGTPLVLFGVPDQQAERNDYEIAVPRLGGLILKHDWNGTIEPLTAVPANERPPVAPVFFAFRVMVGLGVLMLLLAFASLWAWRRGALDRTRWLLDGWRWMSPAGFIALLSGWYVVEIGRQPYVVYGLLRTSDAVSPNISAAAVWSSLIVYAMAYAVIFGAGMWYLRKLLLIGPVKQPPKDTQGGEKTPARPLSLPDESVDAPGPDGSVPHGSLRDAGVRP